MLVNVKNQFSLEHVDPSTLHGGSRLVRNLNLKI